MTLVPANRAGFVTPAVRGNLRRHLGEHLAEAGVDAVHMPFWDAPAEIGAILRGALS